MNWNNRIVALEITGCLIIYTIVKMIALITITNCHAENRRMLFDHAETATVQDKRQRLPAAYSEGFSLLVLTP